MVAEMTRRKPGRPRIFEGQMVPIHVQLSPVVVEVLDDLAEETEHTRSALIRLAIYQYINASPLSANAEGKAKTARALEALLRTSLLDGAPIEQGFWEAAALDRKKKERRMGS